MKGMALSNRYIRSGALYQKKNRHKRIHKMSVKSLSNESWYDIVGFEGLYQVSTMNRVKSLKKIIIRKDGISCLIGERLVGVFKNNDGYYMSRISKNNKPSNISIHRAIAIACVPNKGNLPEVNHIDCVKTNNHPSNLEWVSHMDNMVHAAKSQLFCNAHKGKDVWSAVLSDKDVRKIFNSDNPYPVLAKKYGVTTSTICSIKKGKTWNHITGMPKTRKIISNGFNRNA